MSAATAGLAQTGASVLVREIEVGTPVVGPNTFRATLTNPGDTSVLAVLDLRAMPGMWLLRNQQRQFDYRLEPGESRRIEATYEFERMSPEARLRVRVGPGHREPAGYWVQDTVSFERTYPVGAGNPAALDVDRYFDRTRHGPFEIFAWKGSLAARRVDEIAGERMAAVEAVREILDVDPPDRTRLVFYPDSATKVEQTGHVGVGMARGNTIVEIYNDEIRLDPYHELAHVLAGPLGDVPAMFNEGFAVYVSERLGPDALEFMGSADGGVDAAACRALQDDTAFPLSELSALAEIGSPESRPSVAYPQSASIVKFLIEAYGVERFREVYRRSGETEGAPAERTAAVLDRVLGLSFDQLERRWRDAVEATCD